MPDSETFFEVSRTSLGFVFFSKEAVLALKEIARAEQWGRSVPYYCLDVDLHPSGTVVGLDYSLCQRARDVGYSIYVDRRLRTMHLKEIGYPSFPGDADHTPAD